MARVVLSLAVLLLAAGAAWYLFLRSPVTATSSVDPEITIECSASAGLDAAACGAAGDGILEDGPPSTTFELGDVVRIRLDRGPFGGDCRVEYFLGRYPDDAIWTQAAACGQSPSG